MARRSSVVDTQVMTKPKGHVAATTARAAVNELAPLLSAFLANPFDGVAIRDWYLALAKRCPLWALQERACTELAKTDRNNLQRSAFVVVAYQLAAVYFHLKYLSCANP